MTAAELKRAKELCEAAGPGPWMHSKGPRTGYVYVETSHLGGDGNLYGSVCWMPEDADDRNTALALKQA